MKPSIDFSYLARSRSAPSAQPAPSRALIPYINPGLVKLGLPYKRRHRKIDNIPFRTFEVKGSDECPFVAVFGLGFRGKLDAQRPSTYDTIEHMRKLGIPCFIYELPDPIDKAHYGKDKSMDEVLTNLHKYILHDEASPLLRFAADRNIVLVPHSTSVQHTLRLMGSLPNSPAKKKFKHIVPHGAYLDTAGSSWIQSSFSKPFTGLCAVFNPLAKPIYSAYSVYNRKHHLGTAYFDRWYLKRKGVDVAKLVTCTENATHGQGRRIMQTGRPFARAVMNRKSLYYRALAAGQRLSRTLGLSLTLDPYLPHETLLQNLRDIPITFIHGKNDPAACIDTVRGVVKAIGLKTARMHTVDAEHHPLVEDPKAHRILLEVFKEQGYSFKDCRPPNQIHDTIILGPPAEISPQRRAGFFNTAAGLLKGFIGSRIGNTKMWGQAKGSALNTSDAFRLQ